MYSTEWKKLRDAKIEQKRVEFEDYSSRERNLSQVNAQSQKYLPKDYKGPLKGYYQ